LCRGKGPQVVDVNKLKDAYPVINSLLNDKYDSADEEILVDTCWSISYVSDGSNDRIQLVLDNFNIARLVDLLDHENIKIVTPALRAIGNIATGDDAQTNSILKYNVIGKLGKLLSHSKTSIRKETCWTISNITAGTSEQIQVSFSFFFST
jgi:importin subunit alpha-1